MEHMQNAMTNRKRKQIWILYNMLIYIPPRIKTSLLRMVPTKFRNLHLHRCKQVWQQQQTMGNGNWTFKNLDLYIYMYRKKQYETLDRFLRMAKYVCSWRFLHWQTSKWIGKKRRRVESKMSKNRQSVCFNQMQLGMWCVEHNQWRKVGSFISSCNRLTSKIIN